MGGTWPGSNSYWDSAAASWAPRKTCHQSHFRNKVTRGVTRMKLHSLVHSQPYWLCQLIGGYLGTWNSSTVAPRRGHRLL